MSGRKLACIIGWPVAQSLSPAIHNAAFEALGLDWTYVPLEVRPDAIADGMRRVRELDVQGANVTMPHKRSVVPYLERLEGDARDLGAVNTIVREGDALVGHNTDGPGFLAAVREARFELTGARALVLGAGGAAVAVAVALTRAGAEVSVSARRREAAEGMLADIRHLVPAMRIVSWGGSVAVDLVVNATPARTALPLEALGFGPGMLAVDLIYQAPPTDFVSAARAAGAEALDGLGMLVHQAGLSFKLWTGRDAPIDVMWAAAHGARDRAGPSNTR